MTCDGDVLSTGEPEQLIALDDDGATSELLCCQSCVAQNFLKIIFLIRGVGRF